MPDVQGYRSSRIGGHLYVFDVPIFAECAIGEETFDAAWIEDSFENTLARNASGYWPPMHVRHHGDAEDNEGPVLAAGDFAVSRVGPLNLEGVPVQTVFATLRFTDPTQAMRAEQGQLQWRSIEITPNDLEKRCLSSVALLDHEPPWLKFPNLRLAMEPLGSSIETQPGNAKIDDAQGVTFRELLLGSKGPRASGRDCLAFAFSERHPMPKHTPKPTPKGITKPAASAADPKEDEAMNAAEEAASFDQLLEAITTKSISLDQMERLLAALQSAMEKDPSDDAGGEGPGGEAAPTAGTAAEDEEEDESKKRSLAGVAASSKRAAKPSAPNVRDVAAAEARATAAEIRAEVLEQSTAREKAVEGGLLRFRGKPMGARLRERLENAYDRVGREGFPAYLDDLAAMQLGAGARASEARTGINPAGEAPEEALAYSVLGNAAVDRALLKCAEYDQLKANGLTRRSREAYVRTALAMEGIRLPASPAAR